MSIDLAALLRRRKPERRTTRLRPRLAEALTALDAFVVAGGRPPFVADTTVYIHQGMDRLPEPARRLVETAVMFHCSVCLGELATGLANQDVSDPRWANTREDFSDLFDSVLDVRILTPDATCWVEAGLIAGTLARTQGYRKADLKKCLNDALIYLTAARHGLPVLTANRDEFDLIQQLAPEGSFIHYEMAAA